MKAFKRRRQKDDMSFKIRFDSVTGHSIKEDKRAVSDFITASMDHNYEQLVKHFNGRDFSLTFVKTYNFNHVMCIEYWVGRNSPNVTVMNSRRFKGR